MARTAEFVLEAEVVAVVLKTPETPTLENDQRVIALPTAYIDPKKLKQAIGDLVSQREFDQIFAGLVALRTAASDNLTKFLRILCFSKSELSTKNVFSADAHERLQNGGAMISLYAAIDKTIQHGAGRPELSATQRALRDAIAMVVARLDYLGALAEDTNRNAYDKARGSVENAIEQLETSLFNLNDSHKHEPGSPALRWCEREGPALLATAYGLDQAKLEQAIAKAFHQRIRRVGFDQSLRYEEGILLDLCAWAHAHQIRREGERSRADTVKRALTRADEHAEPDDTELSPPRMHNSVRKNLIAQGRLDRLTEARMVELVLLFGLEAAHDVFLTRQYLMPILGAAAFVGKVALRRQNGSIADRLTAGGLIALNASWEYVGDNHDGYPQKDADILALQRPIADILAQAGPNSSQIANISRGFLTSAAPHQPQPITAREGPIRFFIDSDDRH